PRFGSCKQLTDWYADQTLERARSHRRNPSTLPGEPLATRSSRSEDGVDAASAAEPQAAEIGPVDNGDTGTNVQERGVDEPDITKTDGEVVATLARGRLAIFDVTGDSPELLSRLGEHFRDADEMLLVGDRLVVFDQSAPVAGATIEPGAP